MNDDATCDVIDTSDAEERELLHAEVPGYYQKAWRKHLCTDMGCDIEMDSLGPRTPLDSEIVMSNNNEPSPMFYDLRIPPQGIHDHASVAVTSATPPANVRSYSRSPAADSIPFSSPPKMIYARRLQQEVNTASDRLLMEKSEWSNTTQDPISRLSPLPRKVNVVTAQPLTPISGKESIRSSLSDLRYNGNSTCDGTPNSRRKTGPDLSYISLSPSLQFPHSSSPDPLSLSLVIPGDRTELFHSKSNSQGPAYLLNSSDGPVLRVEAERSTESVVFSLFNNAGDTGSKADVPKDAGSNFSSDPLLFSPLPSSGGSSALEKSIFTESSGKTSGSSLGFRYISLTTPPPAHFSSHNIFSTTYSPLSPSPLSPEAYSSPTSPSASAALARDPAMPTRSYSLRNRSAVQLNPFKYEKRMYKLQLRGVPEAIVKDPTVSARRKVRERYQRVEEADWENRSDAEDEEGDGDLWRRKERWREKVRQREIVEKRMQELGIVVPSEEEDNSVPLELGTVEKTANFNIRNRGTKRKRCVQAREFPMTVQMVEPVSCPSQPAKTVEVSRRPRPRPAFRPLTPGSPKPPCTQCAPGLPCLLNSDQNSGIDLDEVQHTNLGLTVHDTEAGDNSSPSAIEDPEANKPTEGSIRHSRGRENEVFDLEMIKETDSENDLPAGVTNSSELESSEFEMTEKDRKRLKIMGRMMPAALIRKILTEEEEKSKNKKRTNQSERRGAEWDDTPLKPGRGRKRIASPGSRDPRRYEIKEDSENESEDKSEDRPLTDQQVIDLRSNDDSRSRSAELSLEETANSLSDEAIQTWLATDSGFEFERNKFLSPPSRIRRLDHKLDGPWGGDLIDMMLRRTNRVGPRAPKPSKIKTGALRTRNAWPAIDNVTGEARTRSADGWRQTKLKFPKENKSRKSSSTGFGRKSMDHRGQCVKRDAGAKAKTIKEHRRAAEGGLWVNHKAGRQIISGRKRHFMTIAHNDDAFHEALAPAELNVQGHAHLGMSHDRDHQKNKGDMLDRFLAADCGEEPDTFDSDLNKGRMDSHIILDFDIPLIPSGMTFGTESYMGKGRLAQLISSLNGETRTLIHPAITVFEQEFDPGMPVLQFSTSLAAACDCLYDTAVAAADDTEAQLNLKTSGKTMHTLCEFVSFRAWGSDDEDGHIAAAVSEQTAHLVRRLNHRIEQLSADGHILDARTFSLYWFALELELRVVYARRKRISTEESQVMILATAAERYAVLLMRRLLEYGLDRTLLPLQKLELRDITSSDVRTMEIWACLFHLSPFFTMKESGRSVGFSSFWRMVELSFDQQSNKPDSSLDTSERLWRTMFSLCSISQFSVYGLTTSTVRLEQNWTMVSKALGCVRLGANETLDRSKPASTLRKRDKYLRLVTTRCLLLNTRYHWRLHDADSVFRDLCAIFRSRKFSNLLGETADFPTFIRDRDEPLFLAYTDTDTAYGVFLKMIARALKGFPGDGIIRTRKISKLLGIAIPVGSVSFTKVSPPVGQELSMLYNRYSAIIVAVYVDPTSANIHSRLQQVRRYINFKEADHDSQIASIRAMMNLAILIRHLTEPLDDVLAWATEMMGELLENYKATENDSGVSQIEKDRLVVAIQLLLGSVRIIIENPVLNRSEPRPARYPDLALLREDWLGRILSFPSLSGDHRTGVEIRKCVQSFLNSRSKVIPPPPIPRPSVDQPESQDEYGDSGLDMDDPAVLALLDSFECPPDENYAMDQKAGEVMNEIATKRLYSLVCKHFSQEFNPRFPGRYFLEGDQWIECWLGCASVAVRNKTRSWDFYIKMTQAACEIIKYNNKCRRRVYMRFLLMMLQLDPTSYTGNEDKFLEVWFESVVSPEITLEHEFSALLFSVGALRHPVFRNVPYTPDLSTGLLTFEKAEFEQLRKSLISTAIDNIADILEGAPPPMAELYISFIEKMFSTLRESTQAMGEDGDKCAELSAVVHARVRTHQSLRDIAALEVIPEQVMIPLAGRSPGCAGRMV